MLQFFTFHKPAFDMKGKHKLKYNYNALLKCILIAVVLAVSVQSQAQPNLNWLNAYESTSSVAITDIETDSIGNTYVTGYFWIGIFDIDNDSTNNIYLQNNSNGYQIFVAKFDTYGNHIWSFAINSVNFSQGWDIELDHQENIYICGRFNDIVDFDPGTNTQFLNSNGGTIMGDIFLAKYDNNGNYLWAFNIGGVNDDVAWNLEIDSDDNIYITGDYASMAGNINCDSIDFDPGPGVYYFPTCNQWVTAFLAKYSSSGNFIWAKQFRSDLASQAMKIEYTSSNEIILGMTFNQSLQILPNGLSYNLGFQRRGIAIVKLDTSGNIIQSDIIHQPLNSEAIGLNDLILDTNNNVIISGIYSGSIVFGQGTGIQPLNYTINSNAFLAKYSSNLSLQWAKNINPSYPSFVALELSKNNEIIAAFQFQDSADFDPGPDIQYFISTDEFDDGLLCKYDLDGNYICAFQLKGFGYQHFSEIHVNKFNQILTSGFYSYNTDFNPGPDSLIINSQTIQNKFLLKYDPWIDPEIYSTLNDTSLCENDSLTLTISTTNTAHSYQWQIDTGIGFVNLSNNATFNNVNQQAINIHPPNTFYTGAELRCVIFDNCKSDTSNSFTLQIHANPNNWIITGSDTLCAGDSIQLIAPGGYSSYLWNNGHTDSVLFVGMSGTYWVQAITDFLCISSDSINVSAISNSFSLGIDTLLCDISVPFILSGPANQFYEWNTGDSLADLEVVQPGMYTLIATNNSGCIAQDSITVDFYNSNDFILDIGNDTSLCLSDFPILLHGNNLNFTTYNWSNGDSDSSTIISTAGQYILVATNSCESITDTIDLFLAPDPEMTLLSQLQFCEGDSALLQINPQTALIWNTGETSSEIWVNAEGIYSVTATNAFGCNSTDSSSVVFYEAQAFNFDADTLILENTILELIAPQGFYQYHWNTGVQGAALSVSENGLYIVSALTDDGCEVSDSVVVIEKVNNSFIIPTILLEGETFNITGLPANSELIIYSNTGQLVYKSINYQNNFVPIIAQALYTVVLKLEDGNNFNTKLIVIQR